MTPLDETHTEYRTCRLVRTICCRPQTSSSQAGDVAPDDVFEDIMRTLQSTFVFKGICKAVLTKVVKRMHREEFSDGDIIVQQGAQAGPSDQLYYVQACPLQARLTDGRAQNL
jgi:hypothetical protein